MLKFLKDCIIEPKDDRLSEIKAENARIALVGNVANIQDDIKYHIKDMQDLSVLLLTLNLVKNNMQEAGLSEYKIDDGYKFVLVGNNLKIEKVK